MNQVSVAVGLVQQPPSSRARTVASTLQNKFNLHGSFIQSRTSSLPHVPNHAYGGMTAILKGRSGLLGRTYNPAEPNTARLSFRVLFLAVSPSRFLWARSPHSQDLELGSRGRPPYE